eukprot:GFKZ01011190.1.p2 GENE.GFKZ01011190.1~~GFKZ01011190.1.p2  ORF type:complete len:107 (+),score=6.53 GFKZ01011190.1:1287-1607(+)
MARRERTCFRVVYVFEDILLKVDARGLLFLSLEQTLQLVAWGHVQDYGDGVVGGGQQMSDAEGAGTKNVLDCTAQGYHRKGVGDDSCALAGVSPSPSARNGTIAWS